MYPAKAIRTQASMPRRLQQLVRAASMAQRSVIAGVFTVCALVVSGAALAPARNLSKDATITVAPALATATGNVASGAPAEVPDTAGPLPGALPDSLHMLAQPGFRATQVALLGETGSEISFSDDTLLNNPTSIPDLEAGVAEVNPLTQGIAMVRAWGSQGNFRVSGNRADMNSAMTTAWFGAPGHASPTAAPKARGVPGAPGNDGGFHSPDCSIGTACAANDIVVAIAPLSPMQTGKGPSVAPVKPPPPPVGGRPQAPPSGPDIDGSPPGSPPVIVKSLTPDAEQRVLPTPTADLPAISVPEPGSLALLAAGAALLVFFARRRRANRCA